MIPRVSMRRRSAEVAPTEPMEKGNGKNQTNRICLLVSLSLFFWALLLYFHFVVLGSSNIDKQIQLQPSYDHSQPSSSISLRVDKFPLEPPSKPPKEPLVTNNKPILPPAPAANFSSTFKPPRIVDSGSEKQEFKFIRALKTVDNKSDPCGGKYIYVHDLPSRFNEDMLRDCKKLSLWTNMCKFTTNAGLGPPLENVEGVFSDEGWYATNQFAVDVIFSNRMKQYKCLTNDSSLAAAIFVPFYAGFDVARYLVGIQYLN
ncbi:Xyloglucan galactosyltransferase MUR3 [Cardamine amara subsp. amara]|uniref:Xyloglucan galactosyltransferase MUR3 n=1 Tax=Cardamine amara subsp. amara TaxID=228776 RepID=A0ABD1BQA2_CARAN